MEICIIKLGAKGDVIRTLSILPKLKEKFPFAKITWITKKNAAEIFLQNPYVDRVLDSDKEVIGDFDILYCLDLDKEASDIALQINAKEKKGFYFEGEYPSAFNIGAEYYLNTLFDDEVKRKNKKTVQEMMFMAAELDYNKEHCPIFLTDDEKKYGESFIQNNNINKEKLIGIQIGASAKWPSRFWEEEYIFDFIKKANQKGNEILLFGSLRKEDKLRRLIEKCGSEGIKVYHNDLNNTDREFFSLVNVCKSIITPDSFSLHVSLALKKPTICLFFCTSSDEIESYSVLKKIVSPILSDFFPSRMDEYNEDLIKSIMPDKVINILEEFEQVNVVNAIIKNSENKFLVIKRKNESIHGGKWAFPGGIVESNESTEDALKREIFEEVGLNVKEIIKKISEYEYLRPDNKKTKGVSYLVSIIENQDIKISEEVEEFRWVSIEDFDSLDHIDGLEEEIFNAFYS